MNRNFTNFSIVLLSILACALRAQTVQESSDGLLDLADANRTISTNEFGQLTEADFRRAAVAELAAATNAGFDLSKEPIVRSASLSGTRPPARWVWGADNRFTSENTAFQATLAGDLNTTGALTVVVPGAELGTRLVSTIAGLAYCEPGEDAASVFLARTKSCQGELVGLDKVVFRDALEGDGVVADVVIQITQNSLAQDVVIRGRLPGPEYYSDSGVSINAYLTVVTEFFDSSTPRVQMVSEQSPDQTLQWGRMVMVRGKAFSLNDDSDPGVEVDKGWIQEEDSSNLLLEYVPHIWMKDRLEALPILKPLPTTKHGDGQGSLGPMRTPETLLAGFQNPFTPFWSVQSPASICPLASGVELDPAISTLAMNRGEAPGLVIDYILWYQPLINVDFGVVGTKTGLAAIGKDGSDIWNKFHFTNSLSATLANLQWSDGFSSSASVTVDNAPGFWAFASTTGDPMYDAYIYPGSGTATVTVNSVPQGNYDLYIYGHGPAQSANTWFTLSVPSSAGPLSTATSGTLWQTSNWQPGAQFITFSNVNVGSGQQIRFTATNGVSGYTILNGMQIAPNYWVVPVFTLQPQNLTINQGDPASFTASANGAASYQWYWNGSAISGATGASYSIASAQPEYAGTYWVVAGNSSRSTTSASATLTVNIPSAGVPPPPGLVAWWKGETNHNDTIGVNHGVNYTVDFVTGKVGSAFNMEGGTDHVQVPNDPAKPALRLSTGATFEAWVYPTTTGSQLTILSKWDTIWGPDQRSYIFAINPNGTICLAVCRDGTAYNTAAVNSSSTVSTNQWSHLASTYDGSALRLYLNGALVGTTPYTAGIFPSTNDFTIGGVAGQSSTFICPFIGLLDEVSVYNRALTQTEIQGIYNAGPSGKCVGPPIIVNPPVSKSVSLGANVTFNVLATGDAPLSYQWRFNGVNLTGATASTFTTNNVQVTSGGNYSVVVSNPCGSTTSANAVMIILPYISTQPQSQTVYSGSNVTFTVIASGTAPLSYQWQLNGVAIANATSSGFTTNNVQPASAANYSVLVSNAGGSVPSQNSTLTVKDAADPDYDGVPTWLELQNGTDTNNASSVPPVRLGYWRFPDASFRGEPDLLYSSEPGPLPLSSLNIQCIAGGNGTALRANSASAAYLRFRDTEWDGTANINCRAGAVRIWFAPEWTSVSAGGSGPGIAGRLVQVGTGWVLGLDAQGDHVTFSTVTDGTLLSASISWTNGQWHYVCLSYGPATTTLYVDGAAFANGPGVAHYPDAAGRSASGLNIGSDFAGTLQAKGLFDELETFNYQQTAGEISTAYLSDSDADGLPDWWELKHFGNLSQTSSGDADGDGLSNWLEYLQGRKPNATDLGALINLDIFTPLK